jgi:hypothetical protein
MIASKEVEGLSFIFSGQLKAFMTTTGVDEASEQPPLCVVAKGKIHRSQPGSDEK